jgi:tetratricopeptide (TPR) repeat protein
MQFTYERGTQREVLRWVDPLLPRLQGLPPSRGLVRFFTVYGEYLLGLERFDEGLSVSERAVEIARALGDEREVAHAQRRLAFALSLHGRVGEAWSILNDVLAAAERTGDLAEMAHARLLLGGAAWEDADCRTSLSQTEQALDLFQRVGNPIWVAFAINSIGEILAHMGEIDRAEEMGRRALNAVRELDQSTLLAHPLGLLARLSVQRGDRAMVDEYAQELIALSDQSDEPWWRRNGQAILAERDLLEGQPEAAAVRLEEVLLGRYLNFHESTWALPLLAEAYVELGRVDEAEELLNRCFAAAGSGSPAALLRMRYVQARLLTRKEQWDKARAILDDLLSLTRSMPNPLDEGNVLHELAQIHLTRKERDEARKRWKQALAIYGRLGAKPYVQRTEQALAELDSSG